MPTSLLQTDTWAAFKERYGWRCHRLRGVLILERPLPLRRRLLYVPEPTPEELGGALDELVRLTWEHKALFCKVEPLVQTPHPTLEEALRKRGFRPSFETIQPRWRQWIDLRQTEEALLGGMKPKGRYNIKIAQRHNVAIKHLDNAKDFTALAQQTARRQGFGGRSPAYFEDLLTIEEVELWGAYVAGALVAGVIASFKPPFALYLYGASSGQYRAVMAPYLLHWEVMRQAKQRGCTTYDLLAIAPPDLPNHRFAKLGRFKAQFGGLSVQLLGAWDLVGSPLGYRIFKALETLRRPAVE